MVTEQTTFMLGCVSSQHGNERERRGFTLVVLPTVPVTVNTISTDTLVSASSIYFTLLV